MVRVTDDRDLELDEDADQRGIVEERPPRLNVLSAIRRFAPVMHGQWWKLVLTVLLYFLQVGTSVVTVALFAHITDTVLVTGDLSALWVPLGIWVAVTLIGSALSYTAAILGGTVTERILLRLRDRLYAHTQRLAPHTRRRFETGDLIARHSGDVDEIEYLVSSGVVQAAVAIGSAVIYAIAAFVTSWQLALVAFVLAPLLWVVSQRFGEVVKRAARRERASNGRITSRIQEGITHAISIQADNQADKDRRRVLREARIWRAARISEIRADAAFSETVAVVEMLCVMAVIVVGAWQISEGMATIGTLIALTGYLGYMYPQIQELGALAVQVTSATASAERVAEILDAPVGVCDPDDAEEAEKVALATDYVLRDETTPIPARDMRPGQSAPARVEFDDVGFTYPDADGRPVLDHASVTIEPCDFVALLGDSGAGKSTLMWLLLRFYDPTSGVIRLDGVDTTSIPLRDLRDRMALLPQRLAIFHGSVADNIRYGSPAASDDEVVAAATAADATGFIADLPEGFDTILRDGGANLSGGQRQRIGLARAYLRSTPLLILDEPTTGLDASTTARVLTPLVRLARTRTTLLITHDPEVAAVADYTLTVSHGRLVRGASSA
ncbi:ABC transporter ATP-binding protein [Gordonia rhizosphera]|uniref:Putative ABC transporter permease/ATP-binding protein n=1 Tax=Gordonia rhizosphera NBRC 16068 TaxID=1108045 RepID=K6X3V5_9ACTN|nr:ABC transporter ATP-binding protein [Gordonia rhizosphera]GAB93489.1 putative ABC transporter permease/ATP-binding protein [Gordonia rhizosphera NBRC 16068]